MVDNSKLSDVRAVTSDYRLALNNGTNDVLASKALATIQESLEMPWKEGEAKKHQRWYPSNIAKNADPLSKVRDDISNYHTALDNRENGIKARSNALKAVEKSMGIENSHNSYDVVLSLREAVMIANKTHLGNPNELDAAMTKFNYDLTPEKALDKAHEELKKCYPRLVASLPKKEVKDFIAETEKWITENQYKYQDNDIHVNVRTMGK